MVKKEINCHEIWSDKNFLAFLANTPSTLGQTVLISKVHFPSRFEDLPLEVAKSSIEALQKVQKILNKSFKVERSGFVCEGNGVNHFHYKIYPFHSTKPDKKWEPIIPKMKLYFDEYMGFLVTCGGPKIDDEELKKIAEKIKAKNEYTNSRNFVNTFIYST